MTTKKATKSKSKTKTKSNPTDESTDDLLKSFDALKRFLEKVLDRVKAVDVELQPAKDPTYRIRDDQIWAHGGVLSPFLHVITQRPVKNVDFNIFVGYEVEPKSLFTLLITGFFNPGLAQSAGWLLKLIEMLGLEGVILGQWKSEGRITSEIIDGWHKASTLLEEAIQKVIDEDIPRLAEISGVPPEVKQILDKQKKELNKSSILTKKAAAVLGLLEDLPEHRGLTGPEILTELDKQRIDMDQSTLTKNIIPALKEHHRVKNKRRKGYYIDK